MPSAFHVCRNKVRIWGLAWLFRPVCLPQASLRAGLGSHLSFQGSVHTQQAAPGRPELAVLTSAD